MVGATFCVFEFSYFSLCNVLCTEGLRSSVVYLVDFLGGDQLGARDRVLQTKAARWACAGQTFPPWRLQRVPRKYSCVIAQDVQQRASLCHRHVHPFHRVLRERAAFSYSDCIVKDVEIIKTKCVGSCLSKCPNEWTGTPAKGQALGRSAHLYLWGPRSAPTRGTFRVGEM